jgi:hypothetical protein
MVDMANWHRSVQGIRGFLEETQLIRPSFNPNLILNEVGDKMVNIF